MQYANPTSFLLLYLVSSFFVYCVARVLAMGRAPFDVLDKWREWVYQKWQLPYQNSKEPKIHSLFWLYDMITCPFCLSAYVATFPTVGFVVYFQLDWYQTILVLFSLAGAGTWLYMMERNR